MRSIAKKVAGFAAGFGLMCGVAQAGSLVDLRIVSRNGQELPVYWHQGRAYVVGTPGSEYQVRIKNHSDLDVLTVLSVDGVNAISGKTAASDQDGYMFNARSQADIKGWRKSQQQVAAFFFTALPNSYAARTGRPDNVGVIGVAVFRRKPEPVVVPQVSQEDRKSSSENKSSPRTKSADQESSFEFSPSAMQNRAAPVSPKSQPSQTKNSSVAKESEKLGTGHGRIQNSAVSYVEFERASDTPDEVVTVYYDSYNNLVAQGVIAPKKTAPAKPQAFPAESGFVPDPPAR